MTIERPFPSAAWASIIFRPKAEQQKKVPLRTISMTAFQPFGESFSAGQTKFPAALARRTSRAPHLSWRAAAIFATSSSYRTSQVKVATSEAPAAAISFERRLEHLGAPAADRHAVPLAREAERRRLAEPRPAPGHEHRPRHLRLLASAVVASRNARTGP